MNEIMIALVSGLGGAVLAILANILLPCRTRLENPVEIALRKEFVTRDEFQKVALGMSADVRRLHDKIEADQRSTSTKLEGIGTMIGRLEGKIDSLKCKEKNCGS